MFKFRNVTLNNATDITPDLTPLQKSFACDLTLTASISGTAFLILNAIYGKCVSLRLKMLGTLIVILLIFIITTAFVEVDTDKICYAILERKEFSKYYVEGGDKFIIVYDSPTHSRVVDRGVALEPNVRQVFSKVYVHAVSICLLYTTTLSVYPSVTILMQSENYGQGKVWNDVYYMPVVNYLFFNTGDYFGRIICGIFERPRTNVHTVLMIVVLRTIFVPFMLCSNSSLHIFMPILVHSDLAFILMMISFALSNGYITNILLIMAPRCVMQHEKEMASSVMAASLSLGLALGSILSMAFVQML